MHFELGVALRIKGKLDLIRTWVVACSPISESPFPRLFKASPWLAAWSAEFTYSFYDETDEAMAMCEYILSSGFRAALGPELAWAYKYPSNSASTILRNIYFEKAVETDKAGSDTEPWVRKLKSSAMSKGESSDCGEVYKLNDASLLLGMFLRRYSGADDSDWKPCFRGQILEAIDMLGDDDNMNDIYAYSQIATVLLAAGYTKTALEATAVVLQPQEALASSNAELLRSLQEVGFSTYYFCCGGPCNTPFHSYKEIPWKELWACADCIDTAYCEDCIDTARGKGLPYRKCSPEHKFLKVFPVMEGREVAARFEEGKMVVQKEWLDELRREWI